MLLWGAIEEPQTPKLLSVVAFLIVQALFVINFEIDAT